ncbi:contactin-associated protein-like 2 isoform X2 [Daphnia pulicaria]|uniref:contactin-associated protein-like 2 isoform X2 n=1 Tax=Daphnia pulicaria TaxID=35523 RepID=UPI001EECBE4A|nr:contactin-associated protein-like 2 isoform X2 [Daphnia pulicaria]
MARLFTIAITLGLFLISSGTTTLADVTFTLEEQFQKLSDNFLQFKENAELKDQQHIEMRKVLEEKVTRLEEMMELKDRQQEILTEKIIRLERWAEKNGRATTTSSKVVGEIASGAMPRTCREAHLADPSLASGMYWIDPDGQAVGDAPIYVYCDMISETTSIPHDSQSSMNVGHCADPGCYSRAINYNASSRQMSALTKLSAECHQSIKYDCYFAPFEFDGVSYAWWNDKNGNPEYFWSGSDDSVHTCQCGIDRNCVDPSLECNCDSAAPVQLTDSGIISNKNLLPVTRLNFGRTPLESSSGIHTLGPFECSGQVAVTGMPSSCEDLWRVGHTLSGLYSIMGATKVETVFCDFAKLPGDTDFQKWIGFTDVKSSPVYFYVQKSSSYNSTNTPICLIRFSPSANFEICNEDKVERID